MKISLDWYMEGKSNVYHIRTAEQLVCLASVVNSSSDAVPRDTFHSKSIILDNDIDMSGVGAEWIPIGTRNSAFEGLFNGNGHKVFNFEVLNPHAEMLGLFGVTGEDARIKGLSVSVNFRGASQVAGLVAVNGGNIIQCTVSGTIVGTSAVGGISGSNTGVLRGCCNKATIKGLKYVGSMAGLNEADVGEISDSYNLGVIQGTTCVGGITGHNSGTSIKKCFNRGVIVVDAENADNVESIGGISGFNNAGCLVKNCYNVAKIGSDIKYGRFIGGILGQNYGVLDNCVNQGEVVGVENVGGVAGGNHNGRVQNCKNRGAITSKQYAGGVVAINQSGILSTCTNSGKVFTLFAMCGGVVGYCRWGQISGSSNDGEVLSSDNEFVGGVVGEVKYGTVLNCSNTGEIKGSARVGGIAGSCINRALIDSCSNIGNIKGTRLVGGLVGVAFGDIKDSFNIGTVYGVEEFSNIVGSSEGGAVQECYSTGKTLSLLM